MIVEVIIAGCGIPGLAENTGDSGEFREMFDSPIPASLDYRKHGRRPRLILGPVRGCQGMTRRMLELEKGDYSHGEE
jgi:hypothetical protein